MAAVKKGWSEWRSSDGFTILVGRAAHDNDELTFAEAGQNDFWLHVAATPGSHVIVCNPDNLSRLPRSTLNEAAALAAFHSKSRNAGRVAVHWTQRRCVHKERGQPAGQVLLDRYETVNVRPAIPPAVVLLDGEAGEGGPAECSRAPSRGRR